VWLYYRSALSYRNIEEMMAKRGVPVTYETVREWCQKFGSLYALLLRRKRACCVAIREACRDGSVAKFGCSRENRLNTSGAGHVRVQVASI